MTPEDLQQLHVPSDPRVDQNSGRTAFVVSTPNIEEDRYDRVVWINDADGPKPFTAGPGDSMPRWSPDGKTLAFARLNDDKVAQLSLIPIAGGEARRLTEFEYGVEAIEWAPDGASLVVVAVTPTDGWSDLDNEERDRRPRRVTSVPYRFDNRGWIHDRKRHLWLIDADGENEPRCLTSGEHDEEAPAWSPDGARIAFISDREPGHGLVSGNDVWELEVATGKVEKVTERGFWGLVSYRPDGVLHLLGNTESRYPVDHYLYRREVDGALVDLTSHLDRGSVSLSAGPAFLVWRGDDAISGYEDSGRFGVISVTPDGEVRHVVEGERVVTGCHTSDQALLFTASTWDSPGELFELREGEESRLTGLTSSELNLTAPDHFEVEAPGGDLDVWVLLPEGEDPVPLLLNIHGGPASQYGFGFFDEFQVYAGAGYGVVATNPRGSAGKGKEHVRAVVGKGWGEVDLEDIRIAVDAALERYPRLDADRMGLMGGSYGGFMTAWVIGQEDRWKSAVVERALISWTSFAGTSDIGGVFPENYTEAAYPEAWDTWWQMGPLALAEHVSTPTLIIHSENDYRCPIEQAEQYFMALLRNGTTTELLRFPGEGHEMSRSGKPRHRQERFEAILDWKERFLR